MNNKKLLELFAEALKENLKEKVYITVHVCQFHKNWEERTEEEAVDLVNRFREVIGGEVEHDVNEEAEVESLSINADRIRFCVSYFPNEKFKSEDEIA